MEMAQMFCIHPDGNPENGCPDLNSGQVLPLPRLARANGVSKRKWAPKRRPAVLAGVAAESGLYPLAR
jgi:hypothetical protein